VVPRYRLEAYATLHPVILFGACGHRPGAFPYLDVRPASPGDPGRAGVRLPLEAIHRTGPSDALPRIKRERVPTSARRQSDSVIFPWYPNQKSKPIYRSVF
jgi:hypothetical protein